VYSCYPVVPIAFLLKSGLAAAPADVLRLLAAYEVTVTGGLNLAKAPWNNTTLSAIVQMVPMLRSERSSRYGAVHSNTAFGYQQAFAILRSVR
jgi:hypothetical protein